MPALPMTIREHLMAGLRARPSPAPDLAIVVDAFGRVAKVLGRELRQASLGGRLGLTGEKNITGDAQKKLDVFANDLVVDALARTGLVRAIVSEELDDAYLPPGAEDAPYRTPRPTAPWAPSSGSSGHRRGIPCQLSAPHCRAAPT